MKCVAAWLLEAEDPPELVSVGARPHAFLAQSAEDEAQDEPALHRLATHAEPVATQSILIRNELEGPREDREVGDEVARTRLLEHQTRDLAVPPVHAQELHLGLALLDRSVDANRSAPVLASLLATNDGVGADDHLDQPVGRAQPHEAVPLALAVDVALEGVQVLASESPVRPEATAVTLINVAPAVELEDTLHFDNTASTDHATGTRKLEGIVDEVDEVGERKNALGIDLRHAASFGLWAHAISAG